MGRSYDWRSLETKRVRALMSNNAEEYARLCYELGMEPEDQELYNQGARPEFDLSGLEKEVNERELKPLKPLKRTVSNATYKKFYDRGVKLSTNLWRNTDSKMGLLEEYFPGKGGTTGMSPRQIGTKFANMLKYAKRRIQ
tara:strand:- start:707 stop:1126 length:420 start_codon:yes stop_codon:yes gene_type:complete